MTKNKRIIEDRDYYSGVIHWLKFDNYIVEKNRYKLVTKWKKIIDKILESIKETKYSMGKPLFRARKGHEKDKNENLLGPFPWKEIGIPSLYRTIGGPANPLGIQSLYLADGLKTAIAETRPYKTEMISVGEYELKEGLKFVDITQKNREDKMEKFTKGLWAAIYNAFSVPCIPEYGHIEYIPTQYLSERFKLQGYDGIVYASSLCEKGRNIVVFNPKKVKKIERRLIKVTEIDYDYTEIPGDWN